MKVSKLFMGMLTALALSACSDDVNVPDVPDVNGDDSRFMAVEITTTPSGAGSRAVNTEADNIDEDNYEKGTKNENEVSSLRFYFFQANGDPAIVTAIGTNYVTPDKDKIIPQETTNGAPTGWPNVEKKLKAILVLSTKADDTTTGLSSMVAVANYDRTALKDETENLSLSDLQGYVGNYDEDGNQPFVMTSSVFGAANYNCAAQVTAQNLKTSQEEAEANPVNIYIERVVAKVRVAAEWENIQTKELTYDGKTYNAVPLKNSKGDSYTFGSDKKKIYAIFTGWHVTGTAKKSYLFKNVDNWAGWNAAFNGWYWNNPSWFRSYWAINPFLTDDIKSEQNWTTTEGLDKYYLKYYPLSEINKNVIGGTIDGVAQTAMYCQENAGTWSSLSPNDGKKKNYNADATLSNRTQAIFAAILVEEGENGKAEPVEIAEWGGQRYTTNDLKAAMLNSVGSLIYEKYEVKEEVTLEDGTKTEKTTWKTRSIQPEDVEFVTGGSYVVQNGKRYAAYLQLTAAAKGKTFYKDSEGEVAYGEGEVDAIFNGMPKAKIWKDGLTYYYYDIEHLNQTTDETGAETGKYGVVRNHIYDIKLTKIFGLGTPIYTPDEGEGEEEVIIPEKPKDDDTFVAAKIHILSWRVVNNNAELDWD